MWVVLCAFLSFFSGWRTLHNLFPDASVQGGKTFRATSLSMGPRFFPVSYSNCAILQTGENGFRLSLWFIFRAFHPPLFIPWAAVRSVESKRFLFLFRYSRVQLNDPSVFIDVSGRPGIQLQEAYEKVTR
jgi:hypothetical protein